MKNNNIYAENNSGKPASPDSENDKPEQDGEKENVFDDDNSNGKNSLGENPEQILYDDPENVEDASQIVSDGND